MVGMVESYSESGLMRMIWKILGKSQWWWLILCVSPSGRRDAQIARKTITGCVPAGALS